MGIHIAIGIVARGSVCSIRQGQRWQVSPLVEFETKWCWRCITGKKGKKDEAPKYVHLLASRQCKKDSKDSGNSIKPWETVSI